MKPWLTQLILLVSESDELAREGDIMTNLLILSPHFDGIS